MTAPHMDSLVSELSIRAQELRAITLKAVFEAESGHLGGSFSAAEILTALYFHHLRLFPQNPLHPDRDRLFVSKGHCAPFWYSCLAYRGFFPPAELHTLRQVGSRLQGHPDPSKTPGIEAPSGPLGQGLSLAVGSALAARIDKAAYRTYAVLGDGELQAGLIWEAAMSAAHFGLTNLTAILDYNGYQLEGSVERVMNIEPIAEKWRAFGWHVLEIDGHNMRELLDALDAAKHLHGRPAMIIAHTVKGQGVSFMQYTHAWHGKAPNRAEYEAALAELETRLVELRGQNPDVPALVYPN